MNGQRGSYTPPERSKMKSQKEKVLAYLQKGKSITSWEAIQKFRITRLASVIFDLKAQGHPIKSSMVYDVNADGEPCKYSVYWMGKKHDKQ